MVLYTPIPMEQIFGEEEVEDEKKKKRRTIDIGGAFLEVAQVNEEEYEIVRLISSNPSHFLDARFQPGKKIGLKPFWH